MAGRIPAVPVPFFRTARCKFRSAIPFMPGLESNGPRGSRLNEALGSAQVGALFHARPRVQRSQGLTPLRREVVLMERTG